MAPTPPAEIGTETLKNIAADLFSVHRKNPGYSELAPLVGRVVTFAVHSGIQLREIAMTAGESSNDFNNHLRRHCDYEPQKPTPKISEKTREQIVKLLLLSQLDQRSIAAKFGVGLGTVSRIKQELHELPDTLDNDGDQVFANRPHRCPEHGIVAYTPCPTCAAMKAKQQGK